MVSILQMRDPEGPRGVLPDYTGVRFPEFPERIPTASETISGAALGDKWYTLLETDDFLANWIGVPYMKMSGLTNPEVRPRWPHLPNDAIEQVNSILEDIRLGRLPTPWTDGYAELVVKPTKSGKKGKGKGKGKGKSIPAAATHTASTAADTITSSATATAAATATTPATRVTRSANAKRAVTSDPRVKPPAPQTAQLHSAEGKTSQPSATKTASTSRTGRSVMYIGKRPSMFKSSKGVRHAPSVTDEDESK